jgi:hypothetical protein
MWAGMSPVPVQMWQGEPSPDSDVARSKPDPNTDVGGVSPVPAQMWPRPAGRHRMRLEQSVARDKLDEDAADRPHIARVRPAEPCEAPRRDAKPNGSGPTRLTGHFPLC